MFQHVRFRKSFESYKQGQSYRLPLDLADMYVKAGVAECVDHVPVVDDKDGRPMLNSAGETLEPIAVERPAVQPATHEEKSTDDDDSKSSTGASSKRKRS